MFSLRTQILQSFAAVLLVALTLSAAEADSITIVNPNFSAVAVRCSGGWAYESFMGGNCEGPSGAQQDFDIQPGMGWTFARGTFDGLVPGQGYALKFYLGSRYAEGCCDGNQTVAVMLDGKPIGAWKLVSFTPFTLRTAFFRVASARPHILEFRGMAHGDHTAFFSGVSIDTVQ